MAVSPLFLVTKITEPTFGGVQGSAKKDLWRTSFDFGNFQGSSVDFMFPTEREANEFAPGRSYRPSDMLKILRSDQPYVAQEVVRRQTSGSINEYTDKPDQQTTWTVLLSDDLNGRAIEWRFNSEIVARRYAKGFAYYLHDMIGTLPSDPVAVNTTSLSEAIKQDHEAKEAVKKEAEEERLAALELAGQILAAEKLAAEEKAAAIAAAKKKAAAAAAAAKTAKAAAAAKAKAAADAAAKAKGAVSLAAAPKPPLTAGFGSLATKGAGMWTITSGGSEGTYDGKYYATGTFAPKDGQWYGNYAPGKPLTYKDYGF